MPRKQKYNAGDTIGKFYIVEEVPRIALRINGVYQQRRARFQCTECKREFEAIIHNVVNGQYKC